jgi:Family of unknown function (DUF6152)
VKRTQLAIFALAVSLVSLLTFPSSLLAHHGTAGYDMDKVITLTGTVTAFEWFNPHAVIQMDVKGENGEVQHWLLELAAPIHMTRIGWNKNSMKPGDQIVADTHPAKNGAPIGTTGVQYNVLKVVINGVPLPTR